MPIYLGNTEIGKELVGSNQLGYIFLGPTIVQSGFYPDLDIAAFIEATGISGIDIEAITTLVEDLKANNLWDRMKAIYPMIGGTSTTCKYNLKNPQDTDAAYRLDFQGGWTFSSTGAQPNGTTAYANTYLPQTALNNNDAHISYYSRTAVITNGVMIGADSTTRFSMSPNNGAGGAYNAYQTETSTTFSAVTGSGFLIGNRNSNPFGFNSQLYKNGVELQTANTIAGTRQNINFYLAARNSSNTAVDFFPGECAFSSIGDSINGAGFATNEMVIYNTIVQNYQTTLGRQV